MTETMTREDPTVLGDRNGRSRFWQRRRGTGTRGLEPPSSNTTPTGAIEPDARASAPAVPPNPVGYWTPSRMAGVLCWVAFIAQGHDGPRETVFNELQALQDAANAGLIALEPGNWHVTPRGRTVLAEYTLDRARDIPARRQQTATELEDPPAAQTRDVAAAATAL